MSEKPQTTEFISDFDKLSEAISKRQEPKWLNELRTASLNRFNKLGVPTVKDEEWKYTNITPIIKNKYSIADKATLKEKKAFEDYCSKEELRAVFVNGIYSKDLSTAGASAKNITITTVTEALSKNEKEIAGLIEKYKTEQATSFIALNNAFTDNGVFVKVHKNAVCDKLIHIVHVTSASNGESLILPRSIIIMGTSSEATIIESHVCFNDEITYFSNALTDIYLADNATLHYTKSQKESLHAYHIGNTRVWQERDSHFDSISLSAGSMITRNNLDIILNGEGITSTLNGLYSLYGQQHVDNHTFVDHRYPNCNSNQLYKGILNDSSRAVFNGKIFVKPEAQKTNSYQLNKHLLLGKDCRVDTKPQLEIFADDVKCTHGAAIGQLNEDELFYLQTRCIPRQQAAKMLARGFVDDLLNNVNNDEVNRKLHILLEPSFTQFK